MAEASGPNPAGRWWEYYVLRYFVGTVIGAIALVYLTRATDSPLHGLGFPSIEDFSKLGIKEVTTLGALGFAYCYIASAPMLVLHTTRAQLGLNPLHLRWRFWVLTAIAIAAIQLLLWWRLSIEWFSYRWFGVLVFLVTVVIQVAMIVTAHIDRFRAIRSFYWCLAQARGKQDRSVAEYVESYRHLREHGNACAILALEFALTFVLASSGSPFIAALAITMWLLPSAYSWFVGSLLEADNEWRK